MPTVSIDVTLTIGISPAVLDLASILKGGVSDADAAALMAKLKASDDALKQALGSVPSSVPEK
jgi:hypothetical protein